MNFSDNVHHVYKKAVQRIHFVRMLSNIKVDQSILTLFYRSVVESTLTFCITAWFGLIRKTDKCKICKITRKARRLGAEVIQLDKLYEDKMIRLLNKILKDANHPLHCYFKFLRSGVRLGSIVQRTSRMGKSFVPSVVKLFNFKRGRGDILEV